MTTRNFASHGSDHFNAWMEERVAGIGGAVREALGDNLTALVLSGGYARGEGGVVETPKGERPYNDLDFILIVTQKTAGITEALGSVSEQFGNELGIDVDFSRPLTVQDIRRWPSWLMWTDVARSHRVIVGPPDIITRNAPGCLSESPPLIEATRLLLNRGAGLLWSQRILAGLDKPHDPDFVRRNRHKAELAIGDSVILVHRRHQSAYTGRLQLLEELLQHDVEARSFMIPGNYAAALEFRLRPGSPVGSQPDSHELEDTARRWRQAFVYTEGRRAGRSFKDAAEYAAWSGLREPELHGAVDRLRNLVRNAKLGRLSSLYPRESLYRTLPLLLGGSGKDWDQASARFLHVWRRFN